MQQTQRLRRAERARRACEAELRRLLERESWLRAERERFTRALLLLEARERALLAQSRDETRDETREGALA